MCCNMRAVIELPSIVKKIKGNKMKASNGKFVIFLKLFRY